ncbi:MAG: MBL fold metallo-hydrolase [Deltaproteobacteria bacterium]|nr:MBL fold metallo-hydrolase [Deltaproteobacteria bacterium]
MITVTCLGGAGSVTGSCYLVETDRGSRVMVDCGLFQGSRQMEERNRHAWGFDPPDLPNILLTHAHIDHSGRIPLLLKDGFKGRIITSPPTAELCEIMLLDSAHVQEMDAEWQTRKNRRQGDDDITPLYTTDDARESLKYLHPVERDREFPVGPGMRARFRNAGHILGSSIVELWVEDGSDEVKVVFSGDLGNKDQLIIKDPDEIISADYLFVESTYGNRLHKNFDDSARELLDAIRHAVSHGEKVVIPAFALERSQEILYLLGEFHRKGELPDIPVYLDSPLAIKATEIFRKNKQYYDEEARAIVEQGFDPFDMPNLHLTATTEESIAINARKGPAVIISASGMCTAGRIKHHLKHNLWRPGASIIIVGFQAQGTTGRKIVDGERSVKIFREDVAVRAKVFTIGGFSAHADQKGLLDWLSNFTQSRPRVFVVHGEPSTSDIFAGEIRETLGLETHVPAWRETLFLEKRAPGIRSEAWTGESVTVDMSHDLLAVVADMERELKKIKKRAKTRTGDRTPGEGELEALRQLRKKLQSVMEP